MNHDLSPAGSAVLQHLRETFAGRDVVIETPARDSLDHGHTVPIGRPWMSGSKCHHLLVSLPYPWGPQFETCDVPEGHSRILWLLPITKQERDFKRENGLEALEQRFEDAGINPIDPGRESVIEEIRQ